MCIRDRVVYRRKKGGLPGPTWTIPVIGKFADSLRPSLEKYQEGWNSGALSVASVFHIFIVIASSTDYSRKILNSPTYAEPCLVASAKKVLSPDNWVFLNGKQHVDYRKGLNSLFTSRALGYVVCLLTLASTCRSKSRSTASTLPSGCRMRTRSRSRS